MPRVWGVSTRATIVGTSDRGCEDEPVDPCLMRSRLSRRSATSFSFAEATERCSANCASNSRSRCSTPVRSACACFIWPRSRQFSIINQLPATSRSKAAAANPHCNARPELDATRKPNARGEPDVCETGRAVTPGCSLVASPLTAARSATVWRAWANLTLSHLFGEDR